MGLDTEYPPFDFQTRVGVLLIVESASLSTLAVVSLLSYIGYSAVKISRGASRNWTTKTHIHYYFLNLLVSDLVQAIGGVLSVKWVIEGGVSEGTLCTTQGIFKQIGDVGVALTTLSIAMHTLGVLVFRWSTPPKSSLIVISAIWLFITLNVSISFATHKGQTYYGDTEYWCWITEDFTVQRIALEYFWLWFTAFVNIVIYIFLALVVKGILVMENGGMRLHWKGTGILHHRFASTGSEGGAVAMQLMFYPLVYIITVVPVAVVRWMAFCGHLVPFGATCFASILFSSSGLFNVILFKVTRPKLMPTRTSNDPIALTETFTSHFRAARRPLEDFEKAEEYADWKHPNRSRSVSSPEVTNSSGPPT